MLRRRDLPAQPNTSLCVRPHTIWGCREGASHPPRFLFLEWNHTSGWLWLSLRQGCQPIGAAQDTAGMWGCCPGVSHLSSAMENLGSALLLFSYMPAPSLHWFVEQTRGVILLHCNFPLAFIWWLFCSSFASDGTEHFTACAASGCGPAVQACLAPTPALQFRIRLGRCAQQRCPSMPSSLGSVNAWSRWKGIWLGEICYLWCRPWLCAYRSTFCGSN